MIKPEISVIIPTYNGKSRGYLEQTINSVLNQTYDNHEIIICDDGSTDGTGELCKQYTGKYSNIKYYFQSNKGRSQTRNLGISKSKGNYICFLDDDDLWLPEKLEKQIGYFRECDDKNIGILTTWMELINEKGETIGYKEKYQEGYVYKEIFYDNMVNCSAVMAKKEVLDRLGGFDINLPIRQDWDLWVRIAKYYNIYQLKEYLVKYRVHGENISKNYFETVKNSETLLLKNLDEAPSDFDKRDIMGNFYMEQSENFYAVYELKLFREYFWKGLVNSLKRIKPVLALKFILSFLPADFLKFIRNLKSKRRKNTN